MPADPAPPAYRRDLAAADAALGLGRHAEAEHLLRDLIGRAPTRTEALRCLGWLLRDTGRFDEAARLFARVLAIEPENDDACDGLGLALSDLGRREEALVCFERAVTLNGRDPRFWYHRGVAQLRLHRFNACIGSLETAQGLGYREDVFAGTYGTALFHAARHREALVQFDRALTADPTNAALRYVRSECLLGMGDFEHGWREFEARKDTLKSNPRADFPAPEWSGDFPIDGKTILVHAEQGLGDTLQFCRYVPLLARHAKVVLAIPPTLARLLSGLG